MAEGMHFVGTTSAVGEAWTNKITFYPHVSYPLHQGGPPDLGRPHRIEHDKVPTRFRELLRGEDYDMDEEIFRIYVYKQDLLPVQLTQGLAYHAFVAIKGNKYWWTSEKNQKDITIQRSACSTTIDWCCGIKRKNANIDKEVDHRHAFQKDTMKDVVMWIHRHHELDKPYNVRNSNCQDFAERMFKYFA